ncbi:MAG: CIA30 family protein, partial [Paracoccaceae bacterium]|nr:CIA30 family protein [Paracoccaceae bacterium]
MNRYLLFALILLISPNGKAMIVDNLENPDAREWAYFTDTVMGGVSTGQLQYLDKDGEKFYRMTGIVSTENNGGFIQFATRIKDITGDYDGIKIRVRGNNENYQIHLRTRYTPAPWQYYSAEF